MINIVVAGDKNSYTELKKHFSSSQARLTFSSTFDETLESSTGATVVVVDARMQGNGEELCWLLRTHPPTSSTPIILLSDSEGTASNFADQVIPANDTERLVHVIRAYAKLETVTDTKKPPTPPPANKKRSTTQQTGVAQHTSAATAAKPQETLSPEWLPLPPALEAGTDLLAFTDTFSSYLGAVFDAEGKLRSFTPAEKERFYLVSHQSSQVLDDLLAATQSAVNDALKAMDLMRMKQLTNARNSLFDKLTRLRQLTQTGEAQSFIKSAAMGERDKTTVFSTKPEKERSQIDRKRESISFSQKSAITLEAEAKEARKSEPRNTAKVASATSKGSKKPKPVFKRGMRGSAAKEKQSKMGLVVSLVVALGAIGVLVYSEVSSPKPRQGTASSHPNRLPEMKYVQLEQTPVGVMVRPAANDPDGDRVTFLVKWYVNGNLQSDVRTVRLSPQAYRVGDKIVAEVTPQDRTSIGKPLQSAPLEIAEIESSGDIEAEGHAIPSPSVEPSPAPAPPSLWQEQKPAADAASAPVVPNEATAQQAPAPNNTDSAPTVETR